MDGRMHALRSWLGQLSGFGRFSLELASGDASFRRYFRARVDGASYIVMDAPPEMEDCRPFVRIGRSLATLGLHVPEIHAEDLDQGFLLLSDLGTRHYLDELDSATADRMYGDALSALMVIQACGPVSGLPPYDEDLLRREMELFREWLVGRQVSLKPSAVEERMLDATFECLTANALEQPKVCVHRDYHSRNLLVTPSPTPGILDFQDAVVGPVTYDLVSLLRDCYVAWPRTRVEGWARGYFELAVQSGVLRDAHDQVFKRWFDLMGVQRQLKASGIFARLNIRDGKAGFLADIPRTLGYILEIAPSYPELAGLAALIEGRVLPRLLNQPV